MAAYMSRGRGVLTTVRIEHRLSLDELMWAFLGHSVPTGTPMTTREVREAVTSTLLHGSRNDFLKLMEHIDADPDAEERLAWARRMIVKAYRRDFARFPEALAKFEADGDDSA